MTSPRLVRLAEARTLLGGRHPSSFGILPIGGGRGKASRYDLRVIHERLDELSGLSRYTASAQSSGADGALAETELEKLWEKLGAARRA